MSDTTLAAKDGTPTVSSSGRDGHVGGGAVQQRLGDHGVRPRNTLEGTSDSQDTVVDTGDNLADASLDASLLAEISNILARLADDDSGLLGGNDGADGELRGGILLLGAGSLVLAVLLALVDVYLLESLLEVLLILSLGHVDGLVFGGEVVMELMVGSRCGRLVQIYNTYGFVRDGVYRRSSGSGDAKKS